MSAEHVVSIGPSGQVKAMHNDRFALGFLGKQTITRASDIRFYEGDQLWDIWFNVGGEFKHPVPEYCGFTTYEEARAFEVAVMTEAIKDELDPTDARIIRWARGHRM